MKHRSPHRPAGSAGHQRGVIMVVALVTLVVLLIGAAAMIRSMNSSLSAAGSYGFKRDMSNQGARALQRVRDDLFAAGKPLGTDAQRQSSDASRNYSAVMLPTSPEGIPTALLTNDDDFTSAGKGIIGNDIQDTGNLQITVRYLVDRMCTVGTVLPSEATCMVASIRSAPGGTCKPPCGQLPPPLPQPVYRLTVRVTGPGHAQSFFQSTFTN